MYLSAVNREAKKIESISLRDIFDNGTAPWHVLISLTGEQAKGKFFTSPSSSNKIKNIMNEEECQALKEFKIISK